MLKLLESYIVWIPSYKTLVAPRDQTVSYCTNDQSALNWALPCFRNRCPFTDCTNSCQIWDGLRSNCQNTYLAASRRYTSVRIKSKVILKRCDRDSRTSRLSNICEMPNRPRPSSQCNFALSVAWPCKHSWPSILSWLTVAPSVSKVIKRPLIVVWVVKTYGHHGLMV